MFLEPHPLHPYTPSISGDNKEAVQVEVCDLSPQRREKLVLIGRPVVIQLSISA